MALVSYLESVPVPVLDQPVAPVVAGVSPSRYPVLDPCRNLAAVAIHLGLGQSRLLVGRVDGQAAAPHQWYPMLTPCLRLGGACRPQV